ncbi:MAG: zinc ribbon domain-containing protein [Caldimonas sp.]
MSSNPAETAPLPAGISASSLSSLFGAINGLRNRRAVIAMMGCLVAGVLVAGLLAQMGGLMAFLGILVWLVAAGTGVNAAGLLHMDQARGISPRSTVDALVYGLMCIPKLLALGILLFLVELAVFLVIAIVLFLCKIPFLGPVLFAVVFPVSVVVAGITVLGLFLCMLLSLPAIWQGASIMRALSQTLAIARSRIVEAILLLAVVWLLSFIVALIVFGVLGAGLLPTIGMSASIVGFGGLGSMMGGMGGMGAMGGGGGGGVGHAIAGGLGLAVLWAIAASLVAQVYLLGLCLVYLRVTEGLDLSGTEAALRQKLDQARSRASDLGEKARAAANRATAPASPPPPAAPAAMQPPPYDPPVPAQPVYTPAAPVQPAYNPGGMAAGGAAAAAFAAAPPTAVPPAYTPQAPPAASTDIDLSFDELPPASATPPATPPHAPPAYAPPAYAPPPTEAPPTQTMPVASTCPQCLSPITPEDVFCGVCGYRVK